MPTMQLIPEKRTLLLTLLLPAALVLSACGNSRPVAKDAGPTESPFQKEFSEDAQTTCKAANRALLGDGFLTEQVANDKIKGRKAYRNNGDSSTVIEMTVICLPDMDGGSTLYANGLRSNYDLKKSATPASIGVSVLGSVSLPIGQSADSMVKTTDETITDRVFYRKFFTSVENILHANRPGTDEPKIRKETAPAAPTPE
ncbi:MAG: DUF2242 domain-containing protein [Pseudomonadota bacterium]